MTEKIFFKVRLYFTITILITVWLLLGWEYFHGGVQTHHILQQKDLPGISNWWGGLVTPLFTWFLLSRIHKRMNYNISTPNPFNKILYAFVCAMCFGIMLSVFFTLGFTEIPFYMLVGLLITALFFPIYRAECFLGFILGMTFTFGGVLPILIISVFSIIGVIMYLIIRPSIQFIATKFMTIGTSKK